MFKIFNYQWLMTLGTRLMMGILQYFWHSVDLEQKGDICSRFCKGPSEAQLPLAVK